MIILDIGHENDIWLDPKFDFIFRCHFLGAMQKDFTIFLAYGHCYNANLPRWSFYIFPNDFTRI